MSSDYPDQRSVIPALFYMVGNTWRAITLRSHGELNSGNWMAGEVGAMPSTVSRAGTSGSEIEASQKLRDRVQCSVLVAGWCGVHREGVSPDSVLPEIFIHF